MWSRAWAYLGEEGNRARLGFIGAGVAALAAALVAPFDPKLLWEYGLPRRANFPSGAINSAKMPLLPRQSIVIAGALLSCHARPLDWAKTQYNLGNALRVLGERERGTQRLEEAVAAFRTVMQNNLGIAQSSGTRSRFNSSSTALARLGERESGTQRLAEAVAAYRAPLQEQTRDGYRSIGRRRSIISPWFIAPYSTRTTSSGILMMRSKRLMEVSKGFARRTWPITLNKPSASSQRSWL